MIRAIRLSLPPRLPVGGSRRVLVPPGLHVPGARELAGLSRELTLVDETLVSPAGAITDPLLTGPVADLFDRLWAVAAVPCRAPLPDRERELLGLLAAGLTDESAAARLGVSERTVRRTLSALMSRLGARSRFQAGLIAAAHGFTAHPAILPDPYELM